MSGGYTTLRRAAEVELPKVSRSRFLGLAWPCEDPDEAHARVTEARARFHDARHHCFAWRVGDEHRASDDGEPHGSAGAPILQQLDGRGLDRVVVVVVRWFGGVKLGTGGLARAYGAAAGAALDAGGRRARVWRVPLTLEVDYGALGAVQGTLHALGLEPVEAEYTAAVRLLLHLPEQRIDEVEGRLKDATAGAVALERGAVVVVDEA